MTNAEQETQRAADYDAQSRRASKDLGEKYRKPTYNGVLTELNHVGRRTAFAFNVDPAWVERMAKLEEECGDPFGGLNYSPTGAVDSDEPAELTESERTVQAWRERGPDSEMKPFRDFIKVNDGDTLGKMTPDNHVIAIASGSWNPPTAITFGDIRRLVAKDPAKLLQQGQGGVPTVAGGNSSGEAETGGESGEIEKVGMEFACRIPNGMLIADVYNALARMVNLFTESGPVQKLASDDSTEAQKVTARRIVKKSLANATATLGRMRYPVESEGQG